MRTMIRVDLHCHSLHSDGTVKPESVADQLAADHVVFASLVDHDNLAGLPAFRRQLARRGIGFITGVEITCDYQGKSAHLLAYGFDPDHAELRANLDAMWMSHEEGMDSIAGSLRRRRLHGPRSEQTLLPGAATGRIDLADGIALVHRAGGRAFLAHPLFLQPNLDKLEALLPALQEIGLDGLEALYPAFSSEAQARLLEMACSRNLLVSAGSDFHHSGTQTGVEMPIEQWKAFRDAILAGGAPGACPAPEETPHVSPPRSLKFVLRIVLPTVAAMILFGVVLMDIILPAIEDSLLHQKRQMIQELVNAAWGILAEADQEVQNGVTPLDQAQQLAQDRIETLRYGQEGKDYFWLQDMQPRMLMHPYRPDLNGQDVGEFRDPRGTRIFVEFANLVRRQEEGFVDYVWQWKDDPDRLVPKESYIRGFEPWGWIIGTGMYTEDVQAEIVRFERHLAWTSAGVAGLIALLLLYVIRQSLLIERKRREAEEGLRESTERYRALVEAATEGTLLVAEGRCRYANPTLLQSLGYDGAEIELLDLADLLPHLPGNQQIWDALEGIRSGEERHEGLEAVLRSREGGLLDCLLTFSHISVAGRDGLIFQARDLLSRQAAFAGPASTGTGEPGSVLGEVAGNAALGLFRARAHRRGAVMMANSVALNLLQTLGSRAADQTLELALVFPSGAFDDFMRRLERYGHARERLHFVAPDREGRTLSLDAQLVRDADGSPRYMDGCIEDITADARRESERESLIERLQTSLLYLHESVERLSHPATFCSPDMTIQQVAALMTARDSEAALVRAENGQPTGIVTDRSLRARSLAGDVRPDEPIQRVAREAVISISRHAQVVEALLLMQEKGVEHLAVTDEGDNIIGLIHGRDILHLHGSEAAMLTDKVAHAATAEEAIRWSRRAPLLVKALLDSGAHARQATRLLSTICDAVTIRFIEMAIEELGPAPCPFAFLALGSQGRQEMTFFADQDNALLFDPPAGEAARADASRYFLELGAKVCDGLDRAGFFFCPGGVMAKNKKWCASLAEWEQITTDWIRTAEPQHLLEFNVFLDFRAVAGQAELARRLRLHVYESIQQHPPFLPFLANDLMRFRPPPSRFSLRLRPPKLRARTAQLDLKEALLPLIGSARLYAVGERLEEAHTLDRLDALTRRNRLAESDLQKTTIAYDTLLSLRLLHQAECLQENRPLDNMIDVRQLDPGQTALLRNAFDRLAAIQKKISYDFLGGA
jgi:PAS domain S-box-containing protein